MEKVICHNGVVLYWDDTLVVGELVTAYEQGFHILTGIEFREGKTPLAHYVTVLKSNGLQVKKQGVTKSCDASCVRRVTRDDIQKMYDTEVNAATLKRDNLLEFVSG